MPEQGTRLFSVVLQEKTFHSSAHIHIHCCGLACMYAPRLRPLSLAAVVSFVLFCVGDPSRFPPLEPPTLVQEEYAEENFYFWQTSEQFASSLPTVAKAQTLYDGYIREGAPKQARRVFR